MRPEPRGYPAFAFWDRIRRTEVPQPGVHIAPVRHYSGTKTSRAHRGSIGDLLPCCGWDSFLHRLRNLQQSPEANGHKRQKQAHHKEPSYLLDRPRISEKHALSTL